MAQPTSTPRGEHAGTPDTRWETELQTAGERYIPDGQPDPKPNRATRRAAQRKRGRTVSDGG